MLVCSVRFVAHVHNINLSIYEALFRAIAFRLNVADAEICVDLAATRAGTGAFPDDKVA